MFETILGIIKQKNHFQLIIDIKTDTKTYESSSISQPGDIRYDTVEDPRLEQDTDVILKLPRPRFAAPTCTF